MTTEDRLNASLAAVADALLGMRTDKQAVQGHTPGPWRFRFDPSVSYGRFESQANDLPLNDPVVFAVREDWVRYLDETPQGRANARLIAAAPEMLEALRKALDALIDAGETTGNDNGGWSEGGEYSNVIERIGAILAKATNA